VAGGSGSGATLDSCELYNPATGVWTAAGAMTAQRSGHTSTGLPGGKVLVTGGRGYLASTESFDPATSRWTAQGNMTISRTDHTATLLPDGKVLVTGGQGQTGWLGFWPAASCTIRRPVAGPPRGIWLAYANTTRRLCSPAAKCLSLPGMVGLRGLTWPPTNSTIRQPGSGVQLARWLLRAEGIRPHCCRVARCW
jgi:hypothetical protein